MAEQGSERIKIAYIGGIFVILAAIISGVFMILNTLIEKNDINLIRSGEANKQNQPTLVGQYSVPSSSNKGITLTAAKTGNYVFEYTDGAYTTWPLIDNTTDSARWSTCIDAFSGNTPVWGNENNLEEGSGLFGFGVQLQESEQVAIAKTVGSKATVPLRSGELVTLVAVDDQRYYSDNTGSVIISVYYYP